MADVTISRVEIEKMIKDQLEVTGFKWNEDGSISVGIDFDKLKLKEVIKEKEIIHIPIPYYHHYPYPSPTIRPPCRPPYWVICDNKSSPMKLATYQSAGRTD